MAGSLIGASGHVAKIISFGVFPFTSLVGCKVAVAGAVRMHAIFCLLQDLQHIVFLGFWPSRYLFGCTETARAVSFSHVLLSTVGPLSIAAVTQ